MNVTFPNEAVELLVCKTCRNGAPDPNPDAPRAGAVLAQALTQAGVRVTEVECLSNCSRGCTIALRGPGRWTYIYGNLDPVQHVATIIEGARLYAGTEDGLVPWRERPDHFRKNCIARIPPLEVPHVA
jgi:predicted metal-binding protein